MQHGFERLGDIALTFDAPGAGTGAFQRTRPSTNNAAGAVAGWWIDAAGLNHGFVWNPYRAGRNTTLTIASRGVADGRPAGGRTNTAAEPDRVIRAARKPGRCGLA